MFLKGCRQLYPLMYINSNITLSQLLHYHNEKAFNQYIMVSIAVDSLQQRNGKSDPDTGRADNPGNNGRFRRHGRHDLFRQ